MPQKVKPGKLPSTAVHAGLSSTVPGISPGDNQVKLTDSLLFRFASILIVLTTLIVGGFIAYEYSSTKRQNLKELSELSQVAANRMSKYLVAPLWGLEEEQLSESLDSEMMDRQIHSILVMDKDTNEIIIGKMRGENGDILTTTRMMQKGFSTSKKPIFRQQEEIGSVEVAVTSKYAMEKLQRSVTRLLTATVFLYVAILFTVFWILRKFIIKPINLLTKAADRLSHGKVDTNIEYNSKNEIGCLVDAINRLQASLKIAFKLLKQSH